MCVPMDCRRKDVEEKGNMRPGLRDLVDGLVFKRVKPKAICPPRMVRPLKLLCVS